MDEQGISSGLETAREENGHGSDDENITYDIAEQREALRLFCTNMLDGTFDGDLKSADIRRLGW